METANGLDSRLAACFRAVFSDLNEDRVRDASTDTLASWDSLASLTLASVIEEEFGIWLDPTAEPPLGSYRKIADALSKKLGGNGPA